MSCKKHIRLSGERYAYNAPIQSGAVDCMKAAMPKAKGICDEFRASGFFAEPLLQFHDALYFEVSDGIVEDFCQLLKIEMESAVDFEIEIPVEVEVGKTWGTMKKRKM